MMSDYSLADESATLGFGAQLSSVLHADLIIYLHGELGAGKTTLVRGILRGLGYTDKVKSPTYTLVEVYNTVNFPLYHFDLYRFKNPMEWEESGFSEHCNAHSLCLIEWPEQALPLLPPPDLRIQLTEQREGRLLRLTGESRQGENLSRLLAC